MQVYQLSYDYIINIGFIRVSNIKELFIESRD